MAENQYVIFKLDEEEFGIEIMNVREIVPYERGISVPNTPNFVEGIMNYRGTVVPLICLRKRFNISGVPDIEHRRIIVINMDDKQVGFIVDEASQTIKIDREDIEDAPGIITSNIDREYIYGVGKKDKRLIILVDLESVLSEGEKQKLSDIDIKG